MSSPFAAVRAPAPAEWTQGRLMLAGAAAVGVVSVSLAVLQTQWGTLLAGMGLVGAELIITAFVLGLFDAMVVTLVVVLAVWAVGRLVRAPRASGPSTMLVVLAAALAAALIELVACAVELALTGTAPIRPAVNPSRWAGAPVLAAASLSNVAIYVVTGLGCVRRLGWSLRQVGVLAAALASVASGAGALS